MEREDPDACIACGDVPGPNPEPAVNEHPPLCGECLLNRRRVRKAAASRHPSPLAAGDGTYRLGSWWSDGTSAGL